MATGGSAGNGGSADSDCTVNRLTCAICLERYRRPKLLPCFHCFCQTCLQGLAGSSPSFTCPVCRRLVLVPAGGLGALQTNFYIEEDVEAASSTPQPRLCDVCTDDTEATHRCMQCQQRFCTPCRTVHDSIRSCRGHTVVSLVQDEEAGCGGEAASQREEKKKKEEEMCPKHPDQRLLLHCHPCQAAICIQCKLTQHEGHPTADLVHIQAKAKVRLQATLGRVAQQVEQVEQAVLVLEDRLSKVREQRQRAEQEVQGQADLLRQWVDQALKGAVAGVRSAAEGAETPLRDRAEQLRNTGAALQAQHSHTLRVLRDGSDADIAALEGQLSQTDHQPDVDLKQVEREVTAALPTFQITRNSTAVNPLQLHAFVGVLEATQPSPTPPTLGGASAEGGHAPGTADTPTVTTDTPTVTTDTPTVTTDTPTVTTDTATVTTDTATVTTDTATVTTDTATVTTDTATVTTDTPTVTTDTATVTTDTPTVTSDTPTVTTDTPTVTSDTPTVTSDTPTVTTDTPTVTTDTPTVTTDTPTVTTDTPTVTTDTPTVTTDTATVTTDASTSAASLSSVGSRVKNPPREIVYSKNPQSEVFVICPISKGRLWVRYKPGRDSTSLMKLFDVQGREICKAETKAYSRIVTVSEDAVVCYEGGEITVDWIRSDGLKWTPSLGFKIGRFVMCPENGQLYAREYCQKELYQVQLSLADQQICSRRNLVFADTPAGCHSKAVSSSGRYFAFIDEGKVKVYTSTHSLSHLFSCYTPLKPPRDVCFCKMDGQEVLLVLVSDHNNVHVVDHEDGGHFLRYLDTGTLKLDRPFCLATDYHRHVWVGCKGGRVVMVDL